VEFTVDADGILRVAASDAHTGVTTAVDVHPSYGLTEEEIEQMLEEAIDNAEADVDERLLIDARVEAEQIALHLHKAIEADVALLEKDEGPMLRGLLKELNSAMKSTDRQRITDLSHKIDEVSAPFAQRRIERDLQLALSGRSTTAVAEDLGILD